MFKIIAKEVLPHVKKVSVVITGDEEKCSVVIITEPNDKGVPVQPITLRGSAQQVDDGFKQAIQAVFTDNGELFSNYKEVAKDVKSKAGSGKTTASTAKETTKDEKKEEPKKAEVKKEEPKVVYNKDQKTALAKGDEAVAKAEKTEDPDMVNYLEKEYTKKYKAAGLGDKEVADLAARFTKVRKDKGFDSEEEELDNSAGSEAVTDEEKDEAPAEDLFTSTPAAKVEKPAAAKPAATKAAAPPPPKKTDKPAAGKAKEDEDDGMIF